MSVLKRRVLCVGGPHDGKWLVKDGPGHELLVLKIVPFDYRLILQDHTEEVTKLSQLPAPKYEVYMIEKVSLYDEGIWIGLHRDTMDDMDRNPPPGAGWRDAHTTMILRAILQRDVATEMGL